MRRSRKGLRGNHMGLLKVDSRVLDNPRVIRAGIIGFTVHVAGMLWSSRNNSGGHIPRGALPRLADFDGLTRELFGGAHGGPRVSPERVASKLVTCGLWEDLGDGWRIVDFEPRRSAARAERSSAKARHVASARRGVPASLRFEVLQRDGFACAYCGRKAPDVVLHVDHVKPVCDGGDGSLENLVAACADCNLGKGPRGACKE